MLFMISGQILRKGKEVRHIIGVVIARDFEAFIIRNKLKQLHREKSCTNSVITSDDPSKIAAVIKMKATLLHKKATKMKLQTVLTLEDEKGRRYYLERCKNIFVLSE